LREALGLSENDDVMAGLGETYLTRASDETSVARHSFALRRRDMHHMKAAVAALGLSHACARGPMRVSTRAMRAYARRLPGFADSSFIHLWTNLLSTPGTVSRRDQAIDIVLSPPPLDIVWRISGAGSARYGLLDGRIVNVEVRR
jgi:hypothetical protein